MIDINQIYNFLILIMIILSFFKNIFILIIYDIVITN